MFSGGGGVDYKVLKWLVLVECDCLHFSWKCGIFEDLVYLDKSNSISFILAYIFS